ncbi:MAG: putative sulfate exporter family transporter [Gammaproteobacteria bacterium]|nr:putative sulfate exporter family transporter [Gammaproteobacteria bacterium]MCI0590462.1 putative sulfate exporter family transporter [Gammaproteobacteria bacterium]
MTPVESTNNTVFGWQELWRKEDWWAVWIGLVIIICAAVIFLNGGTIRPIAIKPAKWDTISTLASHFVGNFHWYLLQLLIWSMAFTLSAWMMGYSVRQFLTSFIFVYITSAIIFAIGAWEQAHRYNLEPPLVALAFGLLLSNLLRLPKWLDAGFRVEFYIKTGIVLLGATLPFTLIVWAGPIAIVQATIVSIATFAVIYFLGTRLGIDRRLCACLGAGGAVCGVSAAIAMAGAVQAKKEHVSIAITLVIIWAVIMIFFLPFASRALGLHAGVAGAWIGTSEFADAAGLAAAQAYGLMADASDAIAGTDDQAVWAFTLIKVIGRDIWIGVWAFIFALIATMRWETETGAPRPSPAEIWWRFPKFVVGFLVASLLLTAVASDYSYGEYKKIVEPALVGPIKDLRTWAFIFCFLSIGLTTRFREFAHLGAKPIWSFSVGVLVNVIIGFLLSVLVFAEHWVNLPE